MIKTGDLMQSSLSRLCEHIRRTDRGLPYEVRMALLEGEDAVRDWTEVRKKHVDV